MNLYEVQGAKYKTGLNLDLIEFYRCDGEQVILQINGVKEEILFNTLEDANKFINILNDKK